MELIWASSCWWEAEGYNKPEGADGEKTIRVTRIASCSCKDLRNRWSRGTSFPKHVVVVTKKGMKFMKGSRKLTWSNGGFKTIVYSLRRPKTTSITRSLSLTGSQWQLEHLHTPVHDREFEISLWSFITFHLNPEKLSFQCIFPGRCVRGIGSF